MIYLIINLRFLMAKCNICKCNYNKGQAAVVAVLISDIVVKCEKICKLK